MVSGYALSKLTPVGQFRVIQQERTSVRSLSVNLKPDPITSISQLQSF